MRPWVRMKLNPGSGQGRVPLDPVPALPQAFTTLSVSIELISDTCHALFLAQLQQIILYLLLRVIFQIVKLNNSCKCSGSNRCIDQNLLEKKELVQLKEQNLENRYEMSLRSK
ncbi:hypothetical protein QTO34_016942 [Cnephaeus nilssonii]|uniref:Uncharacterized protein n=1 Tax=Cnephaeus nilssonii TaxID=3371016 RepID=A0AA40I470_CNENI|nr:hypothetical protein QTO34_016942 [Eptesicus nilssonii]